MKAAIYGYGVVGTGAEQALEKSGAEVSRILRRRVTPDMGERFTTDINDILRDPDIGVAAECIGGYEPARSYVMATLESGKSVVSSNKQMISRYLRELTAAARERGLSLAFSAAAGGGIPWLANLIRCSGADDITGLGGVMNGTTNFILEGMQAEGKDFSEMLSLAQSLGYAEADPSADIDGIDVRAKISISADLAFGAFIDPETVPALGIRYITAEDVENFRGMGLVCRLTGRAERTEAGAAACVEPMLYAFGSAESALPGAGNIISLESPRYGRLSFRGPGAGRGPTGCSVALDILDIMQGRCIFDRVSCGEEMKNDAGKLIRRYYLRGDMDGLGVKTERRAGSGYITVPVSAAALHEAVSDMNAKGGKLFAASLAEEI